LFNRKQEAAGKGRLLQVFWLLHQLHIRQEAEAGTEIAKRPSENMTATNDWLTVFILFSVLFN